MATLAVSQLSTRSAINGALTALSSFVNNPDWICGTKLELAVPTVDQLQLSITRGEVVLVLKDGTTRTGLALVNPATGRLRWVLCRPAYYADVLTALGKHLMTTWGVRGWAWNEGDNERTKALRAHPMIRVTEERTSEEGVLTLRAEWAG